MLEPLLLFSLVLAKVKAAETNNNGHFSFHGTLSPAKSKAQNSMLSSICCSSRGNRQQREESAGIFVTVQFGTSQSKGGGN